jgi:hypothetical protein
MYRNPEYRKYQYFSAVEWPGGIYVSPTFAGSRAGSLIAMTWATLMCIGREGYVKITHDIIETVKYITKEYYILFISITQIELKDKSKFLLELKLLKSLNSCANQT